MFIMELFVPHDARSNIRCLLQNYISVPFIQNEKLLTLTILLGDKKRMIKKKKKNNIFKFSCYRCYWFWFLMLKSILIYIRFSYNFNYFTHPWCSLSLLNKSLENTNKETRQTKTKMAEKWHSLNIISIFFYVTIFPFIKRPFRKKSNNQFFLHLLVIMQYEKKVTQKKLFS